MRRLLVNDCLNTLGERTFWMDLQKWFGMEFVGGDYADLATRADHQVTFCDGSCMSADHDRHPDPGASLIIRNATWFPPLKASATVPTISLLQDIFTEGPQREMQEKVIDSSRAVVFNSAFTRSRYGNKTGNGSLGENAPMMPVIPLPVDFSVFEPGNAMGLQQALSLPDGCVCWIGASMGAAGTVKGFDIFLQIVRLNPDIPFVAVFKDYAPDYGPPNLRTFVKLPHSELVKVIGACRVGLCTSRMESQHLAGIEMGACGLPMVAPPVGVYWQREDLPGLHVPDMTPAAFTTAIRATLKRPGDPQQIRDYWQKGFDKPVIRAKWEELVAEVERAGT